MSFSVCIWKANFVHTKWYWKIDTTSNALNVLSITRSVSCGLCAFSLSVKVTRGRGVSNTTEYFMKSHTSCGLIVWVKAVLTRPQAMYRDTRRQKRLWKMCRCRCRPVAEESCWHTSDCYHSWSCALHSSPSVFTFLLPAVTLFSHSLFFHSLYLFHVRHWHRFSIYDRSHPMLSLKELIITVESNKDLKKIFF